eukprot:TRINITY_DN187_c0_g1_i6.p1 TRINITY_DN187_c0_g1~~TRINITY_DN187_c0_g1_i6.p1  ORF type:complete len:252 (-),score=47.43 TRINITY_DN187_c0_g1_i6:241-996(-)
MGSFTSSDTKNPREGYHILQVAFNSPGERAGLQPYFDFVIEVNGQRVTKEGKILESALVPENVGKEQKLLVYNTRLEIQREVILLPSDSWGGAGLAGISIRYHNIEQATEFIWRILEVYSNSPAAIAGLEAFDDYIVGSPDIIFNSHDHFFSYIRSSIDVSVSLYVYSKRTTRVRLISLLPSKDWGGEGILGCNVGVGYIHRIPTVETPKGTPESHQQVETQEVSEEAKTQHAVVMLQETDPHEADAKVVQ